MKIFIVLLLGASSIAGCSSQSPEIDITKKYWDALVNDDLESLQSVIKKLTDEESQFALRLGYTGDLPEVYEPDSDGVAVEVVHYCYPNQRTTTFVNEVSGELKVDHLKTLQSLYEVMRKAKTNKEFCYEFSDQPMQGKIDGKEFRPTRLVNKPLLNGTVSELYDKDAKPEKYTSAQFPKIMLVKFNNGNEKSMRGNFGDYTNLTMYSPPGKNLMGLGSFKVSEQTDEGYKLEIYYKHDDDNYLSGFLMVDAEK